MRHYPRYSIALIVAFAISLGSALAGGTLLRFKPPAETTLPYVMTTESKIELTMGAMGTQKMTNNALLDLHLEVVEVDPHGEVTLDFTYDRFRIDAQSFGQAMVFDSQDPEAAGGPQEVNDVFSKMTGKAIQLQVDERGNIQQVRGLDVLLDDLIGDTPQDPQAASMMEIIRSSFSDEAVRGMMQQGLTVFPEGPVGPGDSWTGSIDITNPMVGGMQMDYTYRLEGAEQRDGQDVVRVDFDLNITHDGTHPLLDQLSQVFRAQGSEVNVELDVKDATGNGTLWLQPASGVTVEMDMNQIMEMMIHIEMNAGGQPQTMKMAMNLETRTSMKLSE